jgi:hypothetical protein
LAWINAGLSPAGGVVAALWAERAALGASCQKSPILRRRRCADAILQALLRWLCSGEPVSGVLTGSSEDGPLMTTARQRANKKMPIPTDSEGAQHIKQRPVAAAL